jgi:DNA-binding MarR family transcriptional regulator
VAGRGPWASADTLRDYLAGQPQLDLDAQSAGSLLRRLAAKGLITASAPGPVQLTEDGTALHAGLGRAVAEVTAKLYAGLGHDDLATAHRVLAEITQRAGRLSGTL